jgi:hypothetical protein
VKSPEQAAQQLLVEKVLQGDKDAFGSIVNQYNALMMRTAYMIIGDRDTNSGRLREPERASCTPNEQLAIAQFARSGSCERLEEAILLGHPIWVAHHACGSQRTNTQVIVGQTVAREVAVASTAPAEPALPLFFQRKIE